MANPELENIIRLPAPRHNGPLSVEKALLGRRSCRTYQDAPLSLAELSQLTWAAQGLSSPRGYRTAPSAGALYPLEVYVCAGRVNGLGAGVYKYDTRHALRKIIEGDHRRSLTRAALNQNAISMAPAVFLFCAVFERMTGKYGERGIGYVFMEIGHAAQNVGLQAEALGLGTVVMGAFQDEEVRAILQLAPEEQPLYIVPVGKK